MLYYYVKWKKEKYNGQTPTKSTAFDGHMPSVSLSRMLKIRKKERIAREYLANFFKRAHASTKRTTSRAQSFISTFVQAVPLRVKNTGMQQKIVGYLVQKMSQALQNCSAKCRKPIRVKRSYGTG